MNAIDFECPECGAKPGEKCHTLTGKLTPVSHAKRKRAAFEEETLRKNSGNARVQVVKEVSEKT
jgi:hypothetical protein